MRRLIIAIVALAAIATAQIVRAADSMSWTDNEGTFVLNLAKSDWSFGQMSGQLGSVEQIDGAVYFDGSGDAGVSGYVFGDQGVAFIQSNTGTFTVTGTVR